MQRLFSAALGPGQPPCHGIVHLWSLDVPAAPEFSTTSLEAAQMQNCGSALHLVQILAQSEWPERPRLWFATQGAQPVVEAQLGTMAVAQSPLWGLGRVIAEEHPELWGGLVDVDPTASVTEIATFLRGEMFNSDGEDQLAFYQRQRYVPRLVRARRASGLMSATRWRSDSSYLITGGLGAIGLQVARWAVEQGARRLILMGRTPMPSRADWDQVEAGSRQARNIEAIRELEQLGASVHVASVDVADETQLRTFLESFKREGWPPIRGVVHAAGVVEDRLLLKLDVAALQKVLRPKAIGGWNLHRLLGDVDHFVLFSSLGSLLGQPGQGNYAAANAFLDALANYRRGQGQTGLTINWGAWAGLGFAATSGGQRTLRSLAAQGIDSFTPAQGLAILWRLLGQGLSQVAVMPVDWSRLSAAWVKAAETGFKRRNKLLSQLVAEAGSPRSSNSGGVSKEEDSIRKRLLAAEPEQRRVLLETHLTRQIAQVLRLAPARIEPDKPLGAWGVDSLMALELRNRLEANLELTLPATLIWNYPTVADLANYLAGKMGISLETAVEQSNAGLSAETPEGLVEEDSSRLSDIVAGIAALSDGEALSALLKRK
jgi:NAD(P)-dependent dehydrogenase (short-subunit alcohol dehydrogenase family)/acyl carrier protein